MIAFSCAAHLPFVLQPAIFINNEINPGVLFKSFHSGPHRLLLYWRRLCLNNWISSAAPSRSARNLRQEPVLNVSTAGSVLALVQGSRERAHSTTPNRHEATFIRIFLTRYFDRRSVWESKDHDVSSPLLVIKDGSPDSLQVLRVNSDRLMFGIQELCLSKVFPSSSSLLQNSRSYLSISVCSSWLGVGAQQWILHLMQWDNDDSHVGQDRADGAWECLGCFSTAADHGGEVSFQFWKEMFLLQ